jgi:hypothetical protein
MHVLHMPRQLDRAVLAAVAAAALAIALAVAISDRLNAFSASPGSRTAPTPHLASTPALSPLISSNPLTHGSYTSPFTAPFKLPWAPAPR